MYARFSAAKKAKHWQLCNPHTQARGVEQGHGGGRSTADDRRRNSERNLMPSTVSKTSSKWKYEHDSDNDNLFKRETVDEMSAVLNQTNNALTRSPPSGRQGQAKQDN